MYQYYEIFICLLKFDFFCFVGVTMQVKINAFWDCQGTEDLQLLIVVLNKDSAEFGLTIAAIPVVLILLAGCTYAVKEEIGWYDSFSCSLRVIP